MSLSSMQGGVSLEEIRKGWGWFLALGIASIIIGFVALASAVAVGVAAIWLFGIFLLVGAVFALVAGIRTGGWAVLLGIVLAILYVIAGIWMITNPLIAGITLSLFIGWLFVFLGIIRAIGAIVTRPPQWGWGLFSGLVTLILGVLIVANWPETGFFLIGLLIGIELIVSGISWVALAFAAKSLPAAGPGGAAAAAA